jgi:iron complex transport system ATP-binding protein
MILSVEGLDFEYPSHSVLNKINFTISKGDFLAILGINGAGKSTLLKCINRILNPSKGSILIDNKNVNKISTRNLAKIVGYVAQHQEVSKQTVFDAVLLGRKPYIQWDASENDLKITSEVLKEIGLESYALRYINELSGGEQQKVIIARALAKKPQLLLFDEPTSSLDLKNQFEVAGIIKKVVENRNISAVVTMHDLNLAVRFANRFILLKDGEIFAAGGIEIITSKNIEKTYSIPVKVKQIDNFPIVVPV